MSTLALPASNIAQLRPFDQLVVSFLAKCKTETTLRAYQEDLRNYFAWCQQQQLDPLTVRRAHLDLYVRWMQSQGCWAESTISRRIGTVCGMYKYAAIEEMIPKDPGAGVERPGVDRAKQRRTWLNPVDFAQLLRTAEAHSRDAHAMVALLGMMGLRVGEACSLSVEALTRDKGYTVLSFIGKGNRAARVPVPVPAQAAIEAVIEERTEGPLLHNQEGRRMDRACAARLLHTLCAVAGLPQDITPHSLRRTFVTTGLLTKVPIYDMQLAARHQSPSTTSLYDMAKTSLDRSATHQVAGFLAAMAG